MGSKVAGPVAGKHAERGADGKFRSVTSAPPVPVGDPPADPAPVPPAPPAGDPPVSRSLFGRLWSGSLGDVIHGPRS